jgi:hypothetical protein
MKDKYTKEQYKRSIGHAFMSWGIYTTIIAYLYIFYPNDITLGMLMGSVGVFLFLILCWISQEIYYAIFINKNLKGGLKKWHKY